MISTEMAPILSVRKLATGYGKRQVLFNVSLDVMPGEVLFVTGGNGSGKSTLLKAIYGLLQPWNADAEILFCPDPTGPTFNTQPANLNLSKGLAYLPQENAVFDDLTVDENLRLAGHSMSSSQDFVTRCDEIIDLLPVLKNLLRRKLDKMSGGERQIVALAVVLLSRPKLILLDEPFASLDENMVAYLGNVFSKLHNIEQVTLVIVEHRLWNFSLSVSRRIELTLGNVHAIENYPNLREHEF